MTRQFDAAARKSSRVPGGIGRQAAAIPLLRCADGVTVVLVTSRDTGRWVLPKGWSEPGLSGAGTAAKEAFEEAGLVGTVEPERRGTYRYVKRLAQTEQLTCEVEVYVMQVAEMLDDWPEKAQRQRRAFPPAEAAALVDEPELAALLRTLV